MRIQLSNHIFSTQTVGGISNYFLTLAKYLEEQGNNVELKFPLALTQGLRSTHQYHGQVLSPKFIKRGVTWRAVTAINQTADFSREKLEGAAKSPDIYHRTYYSQIGNSSKIPEVITVHDMIHEDYPQFFRVPISQKKRQSIARASHVICISRYTRDRLIDLLEVDPSLISVIPHGIEHGNSLLTPERSKTGVPYVLFVGGRSGYKNFSILEMAFAEVLRVHKSLQLWLLGGGTINEQEKARFQALGIADNIVLVRDTTDAEKIIRGAQCVVSTSLAEGFGLVPLESICQGIPAVVSDIEVNREIWGESLPLFEPSDHQALASELLKLIESDSHWVSVAKRGQEIAKLHTAEKMTEDTVRVYRKVAGF